MPTLTSIKENKAGFSAFRDNWSRISPFHNSEIVNTGFDIEKLKEIGRISV